MVVEWGESRVVGAGAGSSREGKQEGRGKACRQNTRSYHVAPQRTIEEKCKQTNEMKIRDTLEVDCNETK